MSNRSQITDHTLPPEGRAYKEDVPDTRISPAAGIVEGLKEFWVEVYGYDPFFFPHKKSSENCPLDGITVFVCEAAAKPPNFCGTFVKMNGAIVSMVRDEFK